MMNGSTEKEKWTCRVKLLNKRLMEDKNAMDWIAKNEELLMEDSLLPEYPVNERLPFLENTSTNMERLRTCMIDGDYQEQSNTFDLIMEVYWRKPELYTHKQLLFIENYYLKNLLLKDLELFFGIKKRQIRHFKSSIRCIAYNYALFGEWEH